jgi:hypothetical protein
MICELLGYDHLSHRFRLNIYELFLVGYFLDMLQNIKYQEI